MRDDLDAREIVNLGESTKKLHEIVSG